MLLGLAVCVLLGLVHVLYYWPEVIDDSYIVFRYARNFVRGDGLAFNPGGPQVEGFSTLTWFWLSAAALQLGTRDVLAFVKVAGLLLHLATIVGVWALAGGEGRRSPAWTLLAPLLFAANPFAAYHAVTGLETPLYVALMTAAALAILGLADRPRVAFPALVLSLALLGWTRPEAFGYAAALLVAAWLHHRGNAPAQGLVLRAAWGVAIAYLVLFAWRAMTFGQVFPNTVTAKSAGPSGRESMRAGLQYVGHFFNSLYLPADLAVYGLAGVALALRAGRRDVLLITPVVCASVFSIAVRGDWMHSFRFMVPATPFLAALIARAALGQAERGSWRGLRWIGRLAAVAAAGLLLLFATQQVMVNLTHSGENSFGRSWKSAAWPARIPARLAEGFPARLAGFTRWSLEHVSPRQVVATGDIGFPAWTLDAQVVDLAGLTDRDLGRILPARDLRGYADVLRRRAPDIVVFRVEGGRPAALYDVLTADSGILSGYGVVDSVATYGANARALIYQRHGSALETSRDSVLARYDQAIGWNPRVKMLRRWREAYARRMEGS